jgi:hypothetical protein
MHGLFGWTGKNMSALNIGSSTDERKEKIILTENDIPGEKIPLESLEHGGSVHPNNPCMPCGSNVPKSPLVLQLANSLYLSSIPCIFQLLNV